MSFLSQHWAQNNIIFQRSKNLHWAQNNIIFQRPKIILYFSLGYISNGLPWQPLCHIRCHAQKSCYFCLSIGPKIIYQHTYFSLPVRHTVSPSPHSKFSLRCHHRRLRSPRRLTAVGDVSTAPTHRCRRTSPSDPACSDFALPLTSSPPQAGPNPEAEPTDLPQRRPLPHHRSGPCP
jgi:hypothetical protein